MLRMSPVMVRSCRTERMAPQLGQSRLGIWDKSILLQAQPYGPQSQNSVNSMKFREFIEITSEFKNCVERMRGSEKGERRKEILRGKRPTYEDLRGRMAHIEKRWCGSGDSNPDGLAAT